MDVVRSIVKCSVWRIKRPPVLISILFNAINEFDAFNHIWGSGRNHIWGQTHMGSRTHMGSGRELRKISVYYELCRDHSV